MQTILGPDPEMAVGGLAALSRCVVEGDDEFHKVCCSIDATDRQTELASPIASV